MRNVTVCDVLHDQNKTLMIKKKLSRVRRSDWKSSLRKRSVTLSRITTMFYREVAEQQCTNLDVVTGYEVKKI